MMVDELEDFEVKDSLKIIFITDLSIIISPIIILNIGFLTWVLILEVQGIRISWFTIPLLVLFSIPFFPLVVSYIKKNTPILKIRVYISNNIIEFYLQDQLFIRLLWGGIKEIIVKKEKYFSPGKSFARTFTLHFKGFSLNKSIRLYSLGFNTRKAKLIISALNKFAKVLQIQFKMDLKTVEADEEQALKELLEIKKFLQDCKNLFKKNKQKD